MANRSSLVEALHADSPAAELENKLALYGWLVGQWETDIVAHDAGGTTHRNSGEIHAGWVLEGRAIQDVWMIPRRAERRIGLPHAQVTGNWYGTTLRVYDPAIDAWHIIWTDPATQIYRRQIGRASGQNIVQLGQDEYGGLSRWSFTEIAPDSFHWLGEASTDQGASWRLLVEVFARRVGA
jgi:hypothetical protein